MRWRPVVGADSLEDPVRLSLLGAALVIVIPLGLAAAPTAAATPTMLFVDHGVTCSDTGQGSAELPFCTIQAAANVVLPGQTVMVDPTGTHGKTQDAYPAELDLHRPGTPEAPIRYTTGPSTIMNGVPEVVLEGASAQGSGVTIASHDMQLDGFSLKSDDITVGSAQGITLSDLHIQAPIGVFSPAISVGGPQTTGVTITRDWVVALDSTLTVNNAATGTVVTDNVFRTENSSSGMDDDILFDDSVGTVFTNNTVDKPFQLCGSLLRLQNGASADIENNVFDTRCATDPQVIVTPDSTAATTLDYDVVHAGAGDPALYQWAGTSYASAASFAAATGQAQHNSDADPQLAANTEVPGSDVTVDSANPDAPNTPATDINGVARQDDTLVPNTLNGDVDRGAVETQDPITAQLTVSTTQAPVGGTITATVTPNSPWAPATAYAVDFGDGTVVHSTSPTFTHAYATPGFYSASAQVTDNLGHTSRFGGTNFVLIEASAPTVVRVRATPVNATGVAIDTSGTTDSWSITGATCEWGDGSTPTSCSGQHTYPTSGVYTITATVHDSGGNDTSATTTVTTLGTRYVPFGPTRLLDTRTGTGTGGTIAKVAAGGTLRLKVGGVAGIPLTAKAVALNVTVTGPATGGDVTVYPDGITRPNVSTVNFTPGQTVPNLTVVPIGANGVVDLSVVGGPLNLVADVTGYFLLDPHADGYTAMTSTRLLDTRTGTGTGAAGTAGKAAPVAPDATLRLQVAGSGGVPASGVTAVALNVTVTVPTQGGFITAFPDGKARPTTSNVNFVTGLTVANLVIVPVGADGQVDLLNGSPGHTQLIADVVGYFHVQGDDFVPVIPFRHVGYPHAGQRADPAAFLRRGPGEWCARLGRRRDHEPDGAQHPHRWLRPDRRLAPLTRRARRDLHAQLDRRRGHGREPRHPHRVHPASGRDQACRSSAAPRAPSTPSSTCSATSNPTAPDRHRCWAAAATMASGCTVRMSESGPSPEAGHDERCAGTARHPHPSEAPWPATRRAPRRRGYTSWSTWNMPGRRDQPMQRDQCVGAIAFNISRRTVAPGDPASGQGRAQLPVRSVPWSPRRRRAP